MNNIKILWKYIILLFAVCMIACSDDDNNGGGENPGGPEEPTIDFEVKPGMDLVGKVLDGTTPLANILVSDGYTITQTDANGIYQMKKNDLAKFAFVIIPEDCEVPTKGRIPAFYKKIDKELNMNLASFSLKKITKVSDFTLVAVADPQPSDFFEMERFNRETIVDINKHAQTVSGPVYGITVGDLVWDRMDLFGQYTNAVNKLSFPMFSVIGNHDHNQNIINDDYTASAEYEEHFGPTYYSYNIGDCHFVVLDDVYYTDRDNYEGYITEEQLKWLEEDLKHVSKDKMIILGTHIPTKRRATSTAVTNNQALYDLLAGYKVRIISGHTHYNFTTTISADIEENTLGAAFGAFWSGDICPDGSPNGYAVYEIKGNKINNWYYKGTGQDASYQLKLYAPITDNIENLPEDIKYSVIANIWSWNTGWSVKVFEDDVEKGDMIKYRNYDPLAYDLLLGPDKPKRHPIAAEPVLTDHLFYYKPKNTTWQTIRVEATDLYGTKHIQSIDNPGYEIEDTKDENPIGFVFFEDDFEWTKVESTSANSKLGLAMPYAIPMATVDREEIRMDYDNTKAFQYYPGLYDAKQNSGWTVASSAVRVYVAYGCLKTGTTATGKNKADGILISPKFSGITEGAKVNLKVTFQASIYMNASPSVDPNSFITVSIPAGTPGTIDDETSKSKSFTLSKYPPETDEFTFIVHDATSDTQIYFRSPDKGEDLSGEITGTNNQRAYYKYFKVEKTN